MAKDGEVKEGVVVEDDEVKVTAVVKEEEGEGKNVVEVERKVSKRPIEDMVEDGKGIGLAEAVKTKRRRRKV